MKQYGILFTVLSLVIMSSCKDPDDLSCDNCLTEKLGMGDIKVRLTINDENPEVPVKIYFDNIDGYVLYEDIVDTEELFVEAPLKQYYAVEARYIVGEDTIYAIDGNFMEPKESSGCEDVCWIVKGDVFDVRLKYD